MFCVAFQVEHTKSARVVANVAPVVNPAVPALPPVDIQIPGLAALCPTAKYLSVVAGSPLTEQAYRSDKKVTEFATINTLNGCVVPKLRVEISAVAAPAPKATPHFPFNAF